MLTQPVGAIYITKTTFVFCPYSSEIGVVIAVSIGQNLQVQGALY